MRMRRPWLVVGKGQVHEGFVQTFRDTKEHVALHRSSSQNPRTSELVLRLESSPTLLPDEETEAQTLSPKHEGQTSTAGHRAGL